MPDRAPASDPQAPSLVIVEDHLALRRGVELLLRSEGLTVLGTAEDPAYGYELIARRRPDVSLIDIGLRGGSGLDLVRRLLSDEPELGVLLYSGSDDPGVLADALESGARGFALKTGPPNELVGAIRAVASGGTYFDRQLAPLLARPADSPEHVLSARERQVLDLLARGMSGARISRELSISPETVRTHVRNAMRKLAARTRVHAVTLAVQRHEITLPR